MDEYAEQSDGNSTTAVVEGNVIYLDRLVDRARAMHTILSTTPHSAHHLPTPQ